MRFLLATPVAAAFALSCSAVLAGCGGGASHLTPSVTQAQHSSGSVRRVKGCSDVTSPDGCDTVGQYDVPEYIDSTGAPCDPSAPFDINNPCTLNPSYEQPVQQIGGAAGRYANYVPQCIDVYPGGIASKSQWHQCYAGATWHN